MAWPIFLPFLLLRDFFFIFYLQKDKITDLFPLQKTFNNSRHTKTLQNFSFIFVTNEDKLNSIYLRDRHQKQHREIQEKIAKHENGMECNKNCLWHLNFKRFWIFHLEIFGQWSFHTNAVIHYVFYSFFSRLWFFISQAISHWNRCIAWCGCV